MIRILRFALLGSLFLFAGTPDLAFAKTQWFTAFVGEYPGATRLHTCGPSAAKSSSPDLDE